MENLEKELWGKVNKYIKYLKWIPSLRMVGVCNNLAFGDIDEKSDIDLFVIAKKGRLFTVRFLVTAILHVLGVRRYGNRVAGRFCLSFFVDDSNLDLKSIAIENDVYLAYWAKTMKPVIDDGASGEFLAANSWIKDYFEDGTKFDVDKSYLVAEKKPRSGEKSSSFFEDYFKKRQLKSARRKYEDLEDKSGTIIGDHMLKFHDLDRRKEYGKVWGEKYSRGSKITDQKFRDLF